MKEQCPQYDIIQHNIIVDVLGGYSEGLCKTMKDLGGRRSRTVLSQMQTSVLPSSLNNAKSF